MRLASVLLALTLGGGAAPALAQSKPDPNEERAKELYQNGAMLYEEGRYDDAIVAWQEAYRLSERAELLFNIANAQERLGKYQDALDTLGRYRAYAAADEREALDRRIRNLERRLEEQGTTPATPTTTTPTTQPPTTTAPTTTTTTTPPVTTTPSTSEKSGSKVRVLPIALYTVGVASLGTGAVFSLQARGAREEALGLCVDTDAGLLCPTDAQDALKKDRRDSLIADIGFGVGGAAIIGGTLSLLLGGSSVGADIGPGHAILTVRGNF